VWLVAAAYLAVLGWILFGEDERFLRRAAVDVYATLKDSMPNAVRPQHYEVVLFGLLFVPLGWLAVRLTRRPAAWVAAGCVWLTVMVELAQVAFLDRSGSAVDVIASSAGAILGVVIARPKETSALNRKSLAG
jgi:VanZ family protein